MASTKTGSNFRRLAGLQEDYDSWRTPVELAREQAARQERTSEIRLKPAPVTLGQAKIRQLANVLSEERLGGTHLPIFEWEDVVWLMSEGFANPSHQELKAAHWNAREHSDIAHTAVKLGNAKDQHRQHTRAGEAHAYASRIARNAGNERLAQVHDAWHAHHVKHANAAAHAMTGTASAHHTAPTDKPSVQPKRVKKDTVVLPGGMGGAAPAKTAKAEPPKKAPEKVKALPPEKDPFPQKKPAGATAHWKASMGSGPAPTAPTKVSAQRKAFAHVDDETFGHMAHAWRSAGVAHDLGKAGGADHHVADSHHKASHDHLHAALSLFHKGHHDDAVQHFTAAIHHMNAAKKRVANAAAQGRQRERASIGGGPRAAVGMTRA